MKNEIAAEILSDIAALAVRDIGSDSENIFLYAEAQRGVIAPSLFRDAGNRVMSYRPSSDLTDRLFDVWEEAPEDRKWTALLLSIEGKRFDARFLYPDEFGADEIFGDRQESVLKAKFGDKPIDYSNW